MSGAMKSMMKTTKHALKTIIKERTFADDTLYTIMTDVESKVNKRPLTNVSDNIDDYEALTPNYFLLKQRSMFLSRWTREYLPTLTERKKWWSLNAHLKKSDLALLRDKNLKQSKWAPGRIVETLPGPDNLFRVVRVKTESSYVRSAASLALLECLNGRVAVV